MSRLVGIEITATHLRAVALSVSYRRTAVEKAVELERRDYQTLQEAWRVGIEPLVRHGESVGLVLESEGVFLQHLDLPAAAVRRLEQIVPFELEARLPIDLEELVSDFVLVRRRGTSDAVRVLCAACRTERVKSLLAIHREVAGREAERVSCGPFPLANLVSLAPKDLGAAGPIALVDLGPQEMGFLVLAGGEPVFARTISQGYEGLPGAAPAIVAALRQTLVAFSLVADEPLTAIYLAGSGSAIPGAEPYLSESLEVPVLPLPKLSLIGEVGEDAAQTARYARAIGAALGLGTRPRDPDLRQGPLAFQRGYAFLKEKAPVLSGLAAAILISFGFSAWTEVQAIERDQEALVAQLARVTKTVLNESTEDPETASELLRKIRQSEDSDPMPHADAFDVMVELSSAVPSTIVHDVEELDIQAGHVKLTGILGSAAEAQQIASQLQEYRCFSDVRLGKVTQVVNSDRQKYGLEWNVRCPEDESSKAKKKKGEEPSSGTP